MRGEGRDRLERRLATATCTVFRRLAGEAIASRLAAEKAVYSSKGAAFLRRLSSAGGRLLSVG